MNAREWTQIQRIAARGGKVWEQFGRAECVCGGCGAWHSLPGLGRAVRDDVAAVRLAVEAGWRNVVGKGWRCPRCMSQPQEDCNCVHHPGDREDCPAHGGGG